MYVQIERQTHLVALGGRGLHRRSRLLELNVYGSSR